jgi:hypothetical protein
MIAIKDPREKRYYKADVSQQWCIKHDNGCLVSIGLTVDEDLPRASLEWLRRNGRLTEVTHEQWNHSGCQSSCTLRGAKECRW